MRGLGEYMKIQVLGTGCPKCKALASNVQKALEALRLDAEVEKVTGIEDILKFGILMMPGLVVDGQIKASGRVPSIEEIKHLMTSGPPEDLSISKERRQQ
jgi:small redox-active disulfide protein 2